MEDVVKRSVRRVIDAMEENLAEDFTVDQMARTAMFSKFHFSRVFQRVTGTSPGRFLAAMRLQRAKQLLVSTSLSVTEISHRVGYSSVGTFSSRFSSTVGVSPRTYRQLGGVTSRIATDDDRITEATATAAVHGEVRGPATPHSNVVYVGLFPDSVPQGRPVDCTVLTRPGPYKLQKAPVGTWYVLAYSPADGGEAARRGEATRRPFGTGSFGRDSFNRDPFGRDAFARDSSYRTQAVHREQTAFVGSFGPVAIRPDTVTLHGDLELRPTCAFDPPLLLALLDLRSTELLEAS